MSELEGRVAVVTGGAGGIGLGIAHAAADQGARIALFDISSDSLDDARKTFADTVEVQTYVVDVTDREGVAAAITQVEADLGPVFALFNNAGVIDSVSPSRMRGETWDFVVNVNLHGVYNGIQAVVPNMIEHGEGGFIVNTSSMAGIAGMGSGFAYHATKFAVVGLSEALNAELAHHNISVSVVVPGQVATSIVKNTRQLRPASAEAHSARVLGILDVAHESLQADGVDSREAGRRIVAGMLARRLHVFTDGIWTSVIEAHTASILADLHAAYPQTIEPELEGTN